jgi:hypothetical protein
MKRVFLTETDWDIKVPLTLPNMRTEFAWMAASRADHVGIFRYESVSNYDQIFVIVPKGETSLSLDGSIIRPEGMSSRNIILDDVNRFINILMKNNPKARIYAIQEGPVWFFNDWNIEHQFAYITLLSSVDGVLCHNKSDINFLEGILPRDVVIKVLPSLMVDVLLEDVIPNAEDKVIIGGNFSRWYGGFQSYSVATVFDMPIWCQTSHSMRENEDAVENLLHLPRLIWIDWMKELSKFRYAVHLMPTEAAGTFAMNCAYFGIPCIGNKNVDTQSKCFPTLSVNPNDVLRAKKMAYRLKNDEAFYQFCSDWAKQSVRENFVTDGIEYTFFDTL